MMNEQYFFSFVQNISTRNMSIALVDALDLKKKLQLMETADN